MLLLNAMSSPIYYDVGRKVYCPNMAKYTRRIINDPLKWAVGHLRGTDDKHFHSLSLSLNVHSHSEEGQH